MLADAFEALKKYDWGTNLAALEPIDDAAIAQPGSAAADPDLEKQLLAALNGRLSRDAHDYVCRKLAIVGTAAAVPTLAGLLGNPATSHMARFALERINAPEAGQALRAALVTVDGNLKIGVISSLGARHDKHAVAALGDLLRDQNPAVVRAAALALGTIGRPESAKVLQAALPTAGGDKQAMIDGLLNCAESLLRHGMQYEAELIYGSLVGEGQPRLVRLAATRGLLACADRGHGQFGLAPLPTFD
jgi:HEAT repeat protein